MLIDEIIWQQQFVEKLAAKHSVEKTEVEEVLTNRPRFRFVSKGNRSGEDVYSALGQTDAGRYLIVFFIQKPNRRVMTQTERRNYGRQRQKTRSNAPLDATPEEIGEFWDTHSLADYWDETHEVEFQVNLKSRQNLSPDKDGAGDQSDPLLAEQGWRKLKDLIQSLDTQHRRCKKYNRRGINPSQKLQR